MTSKLLNNGADIEARLVNHWTETPLGRGETALFAAVCDCKDDIVKTLLEAGAHLEARNSYGESVLYQAVGNVTETWTKTLLLMEQTKRRRPQREIRDWTLSGEKIAGLPLKRWERFVPNLS